MLKDFKTVMFYIMRISFPGTKGGINIKNIINSNKKNNNTGIFFSIRQVATSVSEKRSQS